MADRMTQEEREDRVREIESRLSELNTQYADRAMPDAERDEWKSLMAERAQHIEIIEELRARREAVSALAEKPGAQERGATFHTARPSATRGDDIWDLSTVRASVDSPESAVREMRDRAERAAESAVFPSDKTNVDGTRERLARMIATDKDGEVSRHLLATGSPLYARAFQKALAGRVLSPEEERGLNITTPADGGYAVPFTLDPTVILTSDGSVNPLRSISRVETIVNSNKWQGLTSAGLRATYGYAAEATQASDNSPEFGQPELDVEKAQAFVKFTVELQQDWGSLGSELSKMFAEARDDVEADKFVTGLGHGSNQPQGILVGATTVVESETDETFAIDDIYAVEEALPSRFRSRASWVANRKTYNLIRRMGEDDASSSTVLVDRLRDGLANSPNGNIGVEVLGYPAYEATSVSSIPSNITADVAVMVFGDFRHFLIVDRIGMSVELIPHILGADQRPTGERGLVAYWRNSSKVLAPNAFRKLVITNAS